MMTSGKTVGGDSGYRMLIRVDSAGTVSTTAPLDILLRKRA
jgi:hypothetical protein